MQRLGGPGLSHMLPPRTLLPVPTSNIQVRLAHHQSRRPSLKRRGAAKRKKYIPFEASGLVLDLDAEDNRYVRPYDQDVDGEPTNPHMHRRRQLYPANYLASQFEKESQTLEKHFRITAADKFSPWRISDYDVLSAVLENSFSTEAEDISTNDTETTFGFEKDSVFKWNGIPSHVQTSSKAAIAYMLRRQQVAQNLQPDSEDRDLLKAALSGGHSFDIIERLVSNLIQTPQGSELVSVETLTLGRLCAKQTEVPPTRMLAFLNNVVMNLKSQDLPVSPEMLWCAYKASLQSGAFTVAQSYAKAWCNANAMLFRKNETIQALELLSESIATSNPTEARSYFDEPTHQLLAIYSHLVGQTPGDSTTQLSIRDMVMINTSEKAYARYMSCLAQLGSFRTMWYVWHKPRPTAYEEDSFGPNPSDETNESSGILAPSNTEDIPNDEKDRKAKDVAEAIRRSLKQNGRFAELIREANLARIVGHFEGDCQLDMETILRSSNVLLTQKPGPELVIEAEQINGIFEKQAIQESMLALQSYLNQVLSSHDSHDETPTSHRNNDVDS
ncbi:hypothetical protein M426DRAFT_318619 [Hypoxylon sp. CI-4A]|nr:hypothetical protein M426DRAFT_318619 [Hypoxylon sp. CI-4A]